MTQSYYGRLDDQKPKKQLANSILDEYIQNRVDKEIERFKSELSNAFDHIKNDHFFIINDKLKKLYLRVGALEKPKKVYAPKPKVETVTISHEDNLDNLED